MLKIAEWSLLRGQIFQNVLDELQTSDIDKDNLFGAVYIDLSIAFDTI